MSSESIETISESIFRGVRSHACLASEENPVDFVVPNFLIVVRITGFDETGPQIQLFEIGSLSADEIVDIKEAVKRKSFRL